MNNVHPENALTLTELIDLGLQVEVSLESTSTVNRVGDMIFPVTSVFETYIDIIEPMCIEVQLNTEDIIKYKYNPKLLSLDVYNCMDLWFLILRVNHIKSSMEFTLNNPVIKLFNPKYMKIINEIILNNMEIVNDSRKNVGLQPLTI